MLAIVAAVLSATAWRSLGPHFGPGLRRGHLLIFKTVRGLAYTIPRVLVEGR